MGWYSRLWTLSDAKDAKIKALETKLNFCQPLLENGAANRRRCLEHLRARFLRINGIVLRPIEDDAVIEAGNRAAHEPDLKADVALFDCVILNTADFESHKRFLTDIYSMDVDESVKRARSGDEA